MFDNLRDLSEAPPAPKPKPATAPAVEEYQAPAAAECSG
jgi:hypothetical protein